MCTSNDLRDVTKTRTGTRTRARVRARVRHGSLNVDLLPRQTDRRRTRATRWKLLCKYDYIYPAASWQAHILFNEEYCAFLFLSVQSQPFSSPRFVHFLLSSLSLLNDATRGRDEENHDEEIPDRADHWQRLSRWIRVPGSRCPDTIIGVRV